MTRSTKACVTRALVGWGSRIFSGNWVGESILELLEASHLLSAFILRLD